MHILFLDTETNGKPINYRAPMTDLNNWPRIIQLAYQIADITKNVKAEFSSLIKPDGWEIPKEDFWIQHGYSTEKNQSEGIPMPVALGLMVDDMRRLDVDIIVAHNLAFDINILGAEMIRYGRMPARKPIQICTMQRGTELCKIPSTNGFGYKWPKLIELHQFLFGEGFDGAHDAMADVHACRRCFYEMVKREVIILPELQPAII